MHRKRNGENAVKPKIPTFKISCALLFFPHPIHQKILVFNTIRSIRVIIRLLQPREPPHYVYNNLK